MVQPPGPEGVETISQGHTILDKPIGKPFLVKSDAPHVELDTYLKSIKTPEAFINPTRAIQVPATVIPHDLKIRDDAYYTALADLIVAPSQDNIEEHQVFIMNIYKIIEGKLAEENNIFLASDAEVNEEKWSPLALDADIPSAEIIDQEWARMHSHSEFLREQARLNNKVAVVWRVWWTANPPDICKFPEEYKQWFKELKELTASSLNLDLITLREIKTSTEWLADKLEQAGRDPKFAVQQAVERAESVASSKHGSRINMPVPETRVFLPKARSRSADAVLRSQPHTPENNDVIDIKTPTPQRVQEKLKSVSSDISSLSYIDEVKVKQEPSSPKDIVMSQEDKSQKEVKTDLVWEPKSDIAGEKQGT
ncbi:hypothetical protein AX15_004281 [Amanita polypyramis BW_CC]|nr:hypothetical protein AX15_004281 [Amanita polypyramis BW_CC]